jgi:hypothetical protein
MNLLMLPWKVDKPRQEPTSHKREDGEDNVEDEFGACYPFGQLALFPQGREQVFLRQRRSLFFCRKRPLFTNTSTDYRKEEARYHVDESRNDQRDNDSLNVHHALFPPFASRLPHDGQSL